MRREPIQKVQVFLRSDQKAALKSLAARTGKKQSDLIREGVDLVIDKSKSGKEDWREALLAAAGMWKDRTDLDDFYKELRARVRRRLPHVYKDG